MVVNMKNKGFTLIELLVSAGIFSIIVVTIIGVFVSSIKLQDNILSAKKIIGELNYALEFMSRNLRMAVKDREESCWPVANTSYGLYPGGTGIIFKNVFESSQCQKFHLENEQIKFTKGTDQPIDITSEGIKITKLKFVVSGNVPDDNLQPLVTIYAEASAGKAPPIKLQTSVSQRNLDADYGPSKPPESDPITETGCPIGIGPDTSGTLNGDIVYCDNNNRLWTVWLGRYVWGGGIDEPTDSCIGVASRPACNTCDNLVYAGYSDWELPSCISHTEDSNCVLYQFWQEFCEGEYGDCVIPWDPDDPNEATYWSSTERSSSKAVCVKFYYPYSGNVTDDYKTSLYSVRCVRGQ